MTASFRERLLAAARRNRSWVCVGLDPDPSMLAELSDPGFVVKFNARLIEATRDLVCAYKVNSAYYEALGSRGFEVMRKTRQTIPPEVPAILDAKRGDVPHTAERYATAAFDTLRYDAITASPYLGLDALEPFLVRPDRGCFVLVRTTNPGASTFQSLEAGGKPLYETVGERLREWSARFPNLGAVAGGTAPDELGVVRRAIGEEMPLLIPGLGAQGGDPAVAAARGANRAGELGILSASRSVLYAGSQAKIREACEAMRQRVESGLRAGA